MRCYYRFAMLIFLLLVFLITLGFPLDWVFIKAAQCSVNHYSSSGGKYRITIPRGWKRMQNSDLTVWTEDYEEHDIVPDIGLYFPSRPLSALGPCILLGHSKCGKYTADDIAVMKMVGAKHSRDPDVLSLFHELKTSPKTWNRTAYFYLTDYGFISIELYANENDSRTLNSTIQGMIESIKISEEDRYFADESSGSIFTPPLPLPSKPVFSVAEFVGQLLGFVGRLLGASIAVVVLSWIVERFDGSALSRTEKLRRSVLIATLAVTLSFFVIGRNLLFAFCYIPGGLIAYGFRRCFNNAKIEESPPEEGM